MVANARIILISDKGEESVSLKDFFTGPGKTILKPGQILAFIEVEKDTSDTISFYRKIGTRKALSIAKASVAFKAKKANGKLSQVQLAYGSVGPTVIYSLKAKDYLEGKPLDTDTIESASLKAFDEVTPIDDIRSTADYRKLVVKNVLIEELKQFV
jgi:CO/xanthine dehydrogenase FAD-binding subunit